MAKKSLIIALVCAILVAVFYLKFANFSAPEQNELCISKECVSAHIRAHGSLPENFITKKEANALGWSGGDLHKYAPNKSIGGDRFGNYERSLPAKKGRIYSEADIDYRGGARGQKRLVFSNDGLIFYTKDHYKSFEKVE